MNTVAAVVLTLLAIVVLSNLANGTLGPWFAAKFLHKAAS